MLEKAASRCLISLTSMRFFCSRSLKLCSLMLSFCKMYLGKVTLVLLEVDVGWVEIGGAAGEG